MPSHQSHLRWCCEKYNLSMTALQWNIKEYEFKFSVVFRAETFSRASTFSWLENGHHGAEVRAHVICVGLSQPQFTLSLNMVNVFLVPFLVPCKIGNYTFQSPFQLMVSFLIFIGKEKIILDSEEMEKFFRWLENHKWIGRNDVELKMSMKIIPFCMNQPQFYAQHWPKLSWPGQFIDKRD